jgi:urate oxidase
MTSSNNSFFLQPTYGKQSVPVFKIRKAGPRHSIVDMMIKIMLEGDVAASWLTGDNFQILPTETQKNTCYAIALKTDFSSVEDYALALGRDILARHKWFTKATIDVQERMWERAKVDGKEHNHVFFSANVPIKRTAHVVVHRNGPAEVVSGVSDIRVMKTTQSGQSLAHPMRGNIYYYYLVFNI